jgi:hypothetical protein
MHFLSSFLAICTGVLGARISHVVHAQTLFLAIYHVGRSVTTGIFFPLSLPALRLQ